jgi:hypothetical protein
MDNRTIGQLISGFAVKAMGAALAIYVAVTVANYVANVFGAVNNGLSVLG